MEWRAQDDLAPIAAIRHAVDRDVCWVDTAAIYGFCYSEEIVRKAPAEIPTNRRPFVFTKCGLVWDENNHAAPRRQIDAPSSLRHEVEASQKRLDVERIDLYPMH